MEIVYYEGAAFNADVIAENYKTAKAFIADNLHTFANYGKEAQIEMLTNVFNQCKSAAKN
jgi:hypothetical protein